MSNHVAVLNYSIGNVYSLEKALAHIGAIPKLITTAKEIKVADRLIVPGVGAFDKCMTKLREAGLIDPIKEFIFKKKPFLGICVGMQMLFEESDEGNKTSGLSLISGKVQKIPSVSNGQSLKVPHIGWCGIENQSNSVLLKNISPHETFYFLHSYAAIVTHPQVNVYHSNYHGYSFTALIEHENIFGCQFHPEKSRHHGLHLLKNFLSG